MLNIFNPFFNHLGIVSISSRPAPIINMRTSNQHCNNLARNVMRRPLTQLLSFNKAVHKTVYQLVTRILQFIYDRLDVEEHLNIITIILHLLRPI